MRDDANGGNVLKDLYSSTRVLLANATGCSLCREEGRGSGVHRDDRDHDHPSLDLPSLFPYCFVWGAMMALIVNHFIVVALNGRPHLGFSTLFSDIGAAACSWGYVIICAARNFRLASFLLFSRGDRDHGDSTG